jgi:WxcM-like, C-terminal
MRMLRLKTMTDARGALTVIDRDLPFAVRRVFYIYDLAAGASRGGHRHKKTVMALVAVAGSCRISVDNGREKNDYVLAGPADCLILEPEDWHVMSDFAPGAVLLALASEHYAADDYIYEGYR